MATRSHQVSPGLTVDLANHWLQANLFETELKSQETKQTQLNRAGNNIQLSCFQIKQLTQNDLSSLDYISFP